MAEENVVRRYKHGRHVLVAELHRPKVRNAFNATLYRQLTEAIEQLKSDDELHALVITGHGDYFTSGADIGDSFETDDNDNPVVPSKGVSKKFMEAMVSCTKLLVAAVNGRSIGIGVTLLLHCDFVYAVEHATFWTPFMRIGIVPEFGSSYLFPSVLGPQLANDMLMRSRVVDTKRALAHGLVGHVLPAKNFLQEVLADIEPMVSEPRTSKNLPAYKVLMRRTREPAIREAIHQEYVELDRRSVSGETRDALMRLFAEMKPKSSKL